MSGGCFSWFHRPPKWFSAKRSSDRPVDEFLYDNHSLVPRQEACLPLQNHLLVKNEHKEDSPANQPLMVSGPEANLYTNQQIPDLNINEKPSDNAHLRIPMRKYLAASGKEVLSVLQSAAGVIPVPMLQDAIGIALKIIELCEEASSVEAKVEDLQDRVGHLMIIILAHVTDRNEEGDKDMVVKSAKSIEEDISNLLNTLKTINMHLAEIQAQNRWVVMLYKEVNTNILDDCMEQLSVALENFQLANDLRDSDHLRELQSRLGKMASQVDSIAQDVKHVVTAVDDIRHDLDNTRQTFEQFMTKVELSATPLSTDVIARQWMPLSPEVFEGRDDVVEEIVHWLVKEETSRVCILGPGGMGKTSVALTVAESALVQERFPPAKCFWVPCTGAMSATLLLEILYVQLQVPGDKRITLEKVITHLNNFSDPLLILLDNFETPWNAPGSQKEAEDILRQLARLSHVAILVTMRGKHPPCANSIKWQSRNIEATDEEASLRIFHEIDPSSRDDPNVCELLRALGHMPFAVTLMASLGKEADMNATQLLEAWSKSGPDIFSNEDEQHSMNRSISLSVYSHLVQQNSNAVLLLSILSLLPAGTTRENLQWWAPTLETSKLPSAIATLSKAALLLENKQQDINSSILYVVPVVQSFMQQHGRIPNEVREQIHSSCHRYVLAHECRYDHPEFQARSKALAAEDANIQFIMFGLSVSTPTGDISEMTLEALIAFCWHRCDTKPSPDLARHALEVAEASGIERHIAVAKWCLGRTYHFVSEFSLAFQHLKNAYEFFSSPGDLQWQMLGGRCGIDLVDSALPVLGYDLEKMLQLAYDVEARCATLSDRIHGRSLLFVGFALQEAGQGEEALKYLERAKIALEGAGSPLDNAEVYQAIGRVHHQERRISRALEVMEEAWRYAEMSNVPSIQGDISFDLGGILYSANRDADARKYIEKAMVLSSQVGSMAVAAAALEYMGYGYLRQGDYQDAYSAYSAAAQKYAKCGLNHLSSLANIEKITQKLDNSDDRIGFWRPQWDPDESLLYPLDGPAGIGTSLVAPSAESVKSGDVADPSDLLKGMVHLLPTTTVEL